MGGWHGGPYLSNIISSRLNTEVAELTPMLTVSPESLSQQLRLGEYQSHRKRTNLELIQIWLPKRLAKDRNHENSVVNMNVGNQEMLDKD